MSKVCKTTVLFLLLRCNRQSTAGPSTSASVGAKVSSNDAEEPSLLNEFAFDCALLVANWSSALRSGSNNDALLQLIAASDVREQAELFVQQLVRLCTYDASRMSRSALDIQLQLVKLVSDVWQPLQLRCPAIVILNRFHTELPRSDNKESPMKVDAAAFTLISVLETLLRAGERLHDADCAKELVEAAFTQLRSTQRVVYTKAAKFAGILLRQLRAVSDDQRSSAASLLQHAYSLVFNNFLDVARSRFDAFAVMLSETVKQFPLLLVSLDDESESRDDDQDARRRVLNRVLFELPKLTGPFLETCLRTLVYTLSAERHLVATAERHSRVAWFTELHAKGLFNWLRARNVDVQLLAVALSKQLLAHRSTSASLVFVTREQLLLLTEQLVTMEVRVDGFYSLLADVLDAFSAVRNSTACMLFLFC